MWFVDVCCPPFHTAGGPPVKPAQPARGKADRAPRTTSGDALNYQSRWDVPHRDKQWLLQQINHTQFKGEVANGLSNEEVTEFGPNRKVFPEGLQWFLFVLFSSIVAKTKCNPGA